MNNDRKKAIFFGLVVGAVVGAAFAWVASEDVDYDDDEVHGVAKLGATDYFSLGMSLLTLARQFGGMLR